jgi:hypothetical protein
MVEELLEAFHLTFLQPGMLKTLESLPQRVAETSKRELVPHEPAGVVAYWNSIGLTKEEMWEKAKEWGWSPSSSRSSNAGLSVRSGCWVGGTRPWLESHSANKAK